MDEAKRKYTGLAGMLRAMMLDDGDAIELSQRLLVLFTMGSLSGLEVRDDDRAFGIAEMARRAAGEGDEAPERRPTVFGLPGADLAFGMITGRRHIAFCYAEDEQQGFVIATDWKTAERYPLTVPLYSHEPSDVPGIETVH